MIGVATHAGVLTASDVPPRPYSRAVPEYEDVIPAPGAVAVAFPPAPPPAPELLPVQICPFPPVRPAYVVDPTVMELPAPPRP